MYHYTSITLFMLVYNFKLVQDCGQLKLFYLILDAMILRAYIGLTLTNRHDNTSRFLQ